MRNALAEYWTRLKNITPVPVDSQLLVECFISHHQQPRLLLYIGNKDVNRKSARVAGRFMNGLSTELLVFAQVGCRVFFEIGFGDFVQLERFALFGFPVLTHFYFHFQ